MRIPRAFALFAAVALIATACTTAASPSPAASGGGGANRSNILIEVVTHGQASDPFWSIFKNGVDQAGKDMGVKVEYAAPDTFDMTKMAQLIDAAVAQVATGVNGILALGPTGSAPTLAALKQLGVLGNIKLATFDLSKDVLNAIKAGDMLFAIDQQQYLQGYLPIVFLTLNNLYGLVPGGGQPVLTGPGIVDKTNVDKVLSNTGTTR